MGLFGGSSRSSSVSNTTTIDRRVGQEAGAQLYQNDGGSLIVNNTADGAVDLGVAFADAASEMAETGLTVGGDIARDGIFTAQEVALASVDLAARQAQDANDISTSALNAVSAAMSSTQNAARNEETQLMDKIVTLAIPALAIVFLVRGWSK